jgi:hypothetical protein
MYSSKEPLVSSGLAIGLLVTNCGATRDPHHQLRIQQLAIIRFDTDAPYQLPPSHSARTVRLLEVTSSAHIQSNARAEILTLPQYPLDL